MSRIFWRLLIEKIMKLGQKSTEALRAWIGPKTWDTSHPCDWERWYEFVNAYSQEHGYSFDECDLREQIVKCRQEFGEDISHNEQLLNVVKKRISVAGYILDFLNKTKR